MRVNRKYPVIAGIASIVISLLVSSLFLCSSCKGRERITDKTVSTKNEYAKGLSALPTDAAALFSFEQLGSAMEIINKESEDIFAGIVFSQSKLQPFINLLGVTYEKIGRRGAENLHTLLSVHYSAQNELSTLLILSFSGAEREHFGSELRDNGAVIYARSFNGISISRYSGVEYFISDTLLIASASPLVLESSIRHLNSRTSLMDNEEFVKLYNKKTKEENRLLVNHAQTGKIFSGLVERGSLKYSDFVSRFTSWSDFEIVSSPNRVTVSGSLTNSRGAGNYSQIFNGMRSSGSDVMSVLPFNTYSVITISAESMSMLSEKFGDYMKYYRRYNEDSWERSVIWFKGLKGRNISLAAIPFGGKFEYVTLIKKAGRGFISRIFGGKDGEPTVGEFYQKGYIRTLFGDIFSLNGEESFMESSEWFIIGGKNIIEEFKRGGFNNFTMEEYISQTDMKKRLSDNKSLLSVVVNGSEYPDSLTAILRREYRAGIESVNRNKNLKILSFSLYDNIDKGVMVESAYYADSVDRMPLPVKKNRDGDALGWELDTIINIPKGPFKLVDFNTGEAEYLTQLANNWLRLSDKNGKGLWSAPFQESIMGFVEQIDYYSNGKLQMLFATVDRLHLLDRTGRFVSPFPKKIDYDIALGPKVYNLRGENSPAIMMLHTDNTLRLYDKQGNRHRLQIEITTEEIIKEFPELIEIEGDNYWVVRTPVKCMIYSLTGEALTEASGKGRLKSDTEIIVLGGGKVKVTAISGTEYRFDLATGKTDRKLRN
jgi:hypothetical protein